MKRLRRLLPAALALVYLLHNDIWFWNDGRLVLGMPVGLLYHLGYCFTVTALLALWVTADPVDPSRPGHRDSP